jgi:hypothetical protein
MPDEPTESEFTRSITDFLSKYEEHTRPRKHHEQGNQQARHDALILAATRVAVSGMDELSKASAAFLAGAERRLEEVREENRREKERDTSRDKRRERVRSARERAARRIARQLNCLTVFGVVAAIAAAGIAGLALFKKEPPIVIPAQTPPVNNIQPIPPPIVNPRFTVTVDGRPAKSTLKTTKSQPETKGTAK